MNTRCNAIAMCFATTRLCPIRWSIPVRARCEFLYSAKSLPTPLIVAPTGFNGLIVPGADLALARAAATQGMPFTLSSFSNQTLESVAQEVDGALWMQLYVLDNPAITDELVSRAQTAGYGALVVTTDANVARRANGKGVVIVRPDGSSRAMRWMRRYMCGGCGAFCATVCRASKTSAIFSLPNSSVRRAVRLRLPASSSRK